MRAFCYLFLALFMACKSTQAPQTGDQKLAPAFAGLETSGCFGWCPVYKLSFHTDGKVVYEGLRSVEKMGRAEIMLTKAETKELKAAVERTNLWQYPDKIESNVVDAPGATLIAHRRAETKRVYGTVDRPKPLLDLQNLMKSMVERYGYELTRGVNPNDPAPNAPKAELIVKLKKDVNAGNWLLKFEELKLKLVRRIAADNTWLVSYDPEEIAEKSLIDLIKGTEGVLEVQPNKAVQERN